MGLGCSGTMTARRWPVTIVCHERYRHASHVASGTRPGPVAAWLPLRLAALAVNPGGGPGQLLFGGRGALGIPPTRTWAMILMIAGWIIGWQAIGAWRMMTRPA